MWGSGWDKGFSRGQGVVLLDFLEEVASQLALENEEHLTRWSQEGRGCLGEGTTGTKAGK